MDEYIVTCSSVACSRVSIQPDYDQPFTATCCSGDRQQIDKRFFCFLRKACESGKNPTLVRPSDKILPTVPFT